MFLKFKGLILIITMVVLSGCCRSYGNYWYETYFINQTDKDLDLTFVFKENTGYQPKHIYETNKIIARRKLSKTAFSDSVKVDSLSPISYYFSVSSKSSYSLNNDFYTNGISKEVLSGIDYVIINKDTLTNAAVKTYLRVKYRKFGLKESYYTFKKI